MTTEQQVGTFEVDLRKNGENVNSDTIDGNKKTVAITLSVSEEVIQAKENVTELDHVEVKLIREILFSKINLCDFEKREIERFSNDDLQIRRYVRLGQDRLSTLYRTAACVKACMEFRRSMSLVSSGQNDDTTITTTTTLNNSSETNNKFSDEIRQPNRNNVYINGKTLLGENILWFRLAGHKRQHFTEEFKKYLAHQIDQVDSISRTTGFVICIDCTNAGTSNIDLEFASFFTKSILHFRGTLRYVLILNMGWLLSAAWKIIKSWLPQDQRDHVKMASKKELTQYVAEDQLPDYAPL